MHTSLTSTTYPYLIISLDFTPANTDSNTTIESLDNEIKDDIPKNKVTELIKEREKLSAVNENNEHKGEVYIAMWKDNRLYFYNKDRKLVFRSNQKTEMYNHFVNVIYDMNFKDLSKTQMEKFSSTFRIVLDKNTISYDESVDNINDFYVCFTKLFNYLFIQSEITI